MAVKSMSMSLRALSHLLTYPDAELRGHLGELQQVLHVEGVLDKARLVALDALVTRLLSEDALDCEAVYVDLFDRGRSTSLHLFEHVHGDSRDRGTAMVDLGKTYHEAGLYLAPGELPDYLPAVLEFVSTQPTRQARAFLGEIAHILNAVHSALQQRGSHYAAVLAALLELAGEKVHVVEVAPEPDIDEAWQEPEAFDGCSTRGQARPDAPQPVHFVRDRASHQIGAAK